VLRLAVDTDRDAVRRGRVTLQAKSSGLSILARDDAQLHVVVAGDSASSSSCRVVAIGDDGSFEVGEPLPEHCVATLDVGVRADASRACAHVIAVQLCYEKETGERFDTSVLVDAEFVEPMQCAWRLVEAPDQAERLLLAQVLMRVTCHQRVRVVDTELHIDGDGYRQAGTEHAAGWRECNGAALRGATMVRGQELSLVYALERQRIDGSASSAPSNAAFVAHLELLPSGRTLDYERRFELPSMAPPTFECSVRIVDSDDDSDDDKCDRRAASPLRIVASITLLDRSALPSDAVTVHARLVADDRWLIVGLAETNVAIDQDLLAGKPRQLHTSIVAVAPGQLRLPHIEFCNVADRSATIRCTQCPPTECVNILPVNRFVSSFC
jgi:hypothetical protein